MFDKLKKTIQPYLDIIYPDLCIACDEESPIQSSVFCLNCLDELPFTNFHDDRENLVEKYFWGRLEVEKATALFFFHKGEQVQEMIHRLKYKGASFVGDRLGIFFGYQLMQSSFLNDIDLIIPIPVHKSKKRTREYNQCELLANGISKVSGIPVSTKIVLKNIRTDSQTEKNREERLTSLKNTFKVANPLEIKGRNILIIDDILTTGATLEAVGSILTNFGAKVNIAVVAVGKY